MKSKIIKTMIKIPDLKELFVGSITLFVLGGLFFGLSMGMLCLIGLVMRMINKIR